MKFRKKSPKMLPNPYLYIGNVPSNRPKCGQLVEFLPNGRIFAQSRHPDTDGVNGSILRMLDCYLLKTKGLSGIRLDRITCVHSLGSRQSMYANILLCFLNS
jgi:hypothetical protein